jgi:hypothetical protein
LGRRYCNLPATGIGGLLAYMGPQQRLKISSCHNRDCVDDSVTAQRLATA